MYARRTGCNRDGRFDTEQWPALPFSMQLCALWVALVRRAEGMTFGELSSDETDRDENQMTEFSMKQRAVLPFST